MKKKKSISGATLVLGISTMLLAGTTGIGVYTYSHQVELTDKERELRLEVEDYNGKLIDKIDTYEKKINEKDKVEKQLRDNLELDKNKIKSLEENIESKNSKINKLEKDLHSKREREKQEKLLTQRKVKKSLKFKAEERGVANSDNNISSNDNGARETVKVTSSDNISGNSFIGNISYYSNHQQSTGKTSGHPLFGVTASGKKTQVGVTAACGSNIPFGTRIHIEGVGNRICLDRGSAIGSKSVDVYVLTESEAYSRGRHSAKVTILN